MRKSILTALLLSIMLITGMNPVFADDTLSENTTFDFTNTNIPVSGVDLSISKTLLGDRITETDEETAFRILFELSDLTPGDTYVLDMSLAGENAQNETLTVNEQGKVTGEVSLKSEERAIIRELPPGTKYKVWEILGDTAQSSDYIPAYTVDDGTDTVVSPEGYGEEAVGNAYGISTATETMKKKHNSEVVIKNIKAGTHDLTVKKAITVDGQNVPSDTKFEFTIVFDELEPNDTYTYDTNKTFTTDNKGHAEVTFSISSKESMVFKNLPGTLMGTISEDASGYLPKVSARPTEGTEDPETPVLYIDEALISMNGSTFTAAFDSMSDDATLTVTNQRKTKNDLTIQKNFSGPLAAQSGPATFDVTFTNLEVSTEYDTVKTLLGGEDTEGITETIEVIPGQACTYTLMSPDDGNDAEVSAGGQHIADKVIANGTITLTAAEVAQVIENNPGGTAQVTYHTPGTVTQGSIQSTYEGQYTGTITLNANETFTFKNIPDTAIYRITERPSANVASQYEVDEDGTTGVNSATGKAGRGETLSTPKESLNIDRTYVFSNEAHQADPIKRVSDTDNVKKDGEGPEVDVLENTVPDMNSLWSYRVAQTVVGPVTSYTFVDELPANVCAYLLNDQENSITGAQFLWHAAGGSTYGGMITPEITETAGAEPEDPVTVDERFYVYDGERKIFEVVANGELATDEFEVILLDSELKSIGGVFEANFTAGLAPGTKESDLAKSNQKVSAGEYAVINNSRTLIGDNRYRSNSVTTNFPIPRGLTVKKNVGTAGDLNKEYPFTINLSGLTPGEEYTYTIPEDYKVTVTNDGRAISISAKDAAGNDVSGVKMKIKDSDGDSCGTVRSGENSTTLTEGTYTGQLSYGDATPIQIEFRLEKEDGEYVLVGDTAATIIGGEVIPFKSTSAGTKKISFSLKHDQKILFPDLPDECIYQITEEAVKNYTSSYKVGEGALAVEMEEDENKRPNEALSTPEEEYMNGTPVEYVFTNEPARIDVPIDKISAQTGNALPGAHLSVHAGSPDGELVDSWISDGRTHTVKVGYDIEYYLVEDEAPENFTKAEPIRFRVIDDSGDDIIQVNYDPYSPPRGDASTVAYAEFDSSTGTLRIFRGTNGQYSDGQTEGTKTYYAGIEDITGFTLPKWYQNRASITNVVIEDYFAPKTAASMFSECSSLTSIQGMENLDTTNVENMYCMFYECSSLTSLDMTGISTSNVTRMDWMFYDCSKLTSLDLSSFDTSNVTNMGYMFRCCTSLLNLEGLTSFDTSKVTNMSSMFANDRSSASMPFRTLDLSSFDTSSVTDMSYMFERCGSLTTIFVSDKWTVAAVTSSNGMFSDCTSLEGEKGTGYSFSSRDKTRAVIDDAPDTPGYLTYKEAPVIVPKGWNEIETVNLTMKNERKRFPVKFEKLDKVSGATVAGASYRLEDAVGNTVATWTSETRPTQIDDLLSGTYTVVEVSPPPGTTYIAHDPVSFVLDEDGFVHSTTTRAASGNIVRLYEPKNISVSFSKQDVSTHGEVEGAVFTLYDAEGTTIHTWTSDGTQKTWTDLVAGEEYRLSETTAPPYYERQTNDIWFRTDENDNVAIKQLDDTWASREDSLVIMNDTRSTVQFSFKKVSAGETTQLPGADVKVMEGEYTTTHVGGNLAGRTIALTEKDASTFTVTVKNGNNAVSGATITSIGASPVTLTTNASGEADIAKTTYNSKFAGLDASLVISGSTETVFMPTGAGTATTEVDHWTTTASQKQLTLQEGKVYTYVETAAPTGYLIARPIVFRVSDSGAIELRNGSGQWTAITGTTVTMEDTPASKNDIVVTKNVTGSLGDTSKEFLFTLTFTGLGAAKDYSISGQADGTALSTTSGVVIQGASVGTKKSNTEFTSNSSGNATITVKLKDDQVLVVKELPLNATYAVSEAASDHVASYAATSSNAIITSASGANQAKDTALSTTTETVDSGDETVIIAYTNHREMATNTSVASYMYLWLMLALFVLILAIAVLIRRRRARKQYLE